MSDRVVVRTIAFLDLAGFTGLTDVHGDATAVSVADRFVSVVTEELAPGAVLVKTLGDGVLLSAPDPGAALRTATRVVERLHEAEAMPEISGGIWHGELIERDGDVFGAGVNLAARLAELAPASALVTTSEPARAASDLDLLVEPLGAILVRGVHDAVELFRVAPCDRRDHPAERDPVCGMRIRPGDGALQRPDGADTRWFCASGCAARFDADPVRYRPSADR